MQRSVDRSVGLLLCLQLGFERLNVPAPNLHGSERTEELTQRLEMGSHLRRHFTRNALLASALVVLYKVVKNLVHSHTFLLRVAESLDSLLVVFNLPDFPLQEVLRLLLIRFPCGLADLLSAQVEGTPPKLTAWMLVQSAVASHPALLSLRLPSIRRFG